MRIRLLILGTLLAAACFPMAAQQSLSEANCWGTVPLMPGIAKAGPEMTAYRALPNLMIDDEVARFASGYHRLCIVQSDSLRCWQRMNHTFR